MSKFIKNVIYCIGFILIVLVMVLNIFFTATMRQNEVVYIHINPFLLFAIPIVMAIVMRFIFSIVKKYSYKIRKKYIIFGVVIFIYVVIQVLYISANRTEPVADQKSAYDLAIAMTNGNERQCIENETAYEGVLSNKIYFERCQQQFTIAFIWNIVFRLLNSTNYIIIEYFNVFFNVITVISIFMICKLLSKKYKVNKYLGVFITLTFVSLALFVTFKYGDIAGLSLSLLGTYFIMKYIGEKKKKYLIFSILSIALSYMFRMNTLIFIIAIAIYLFLDLISSKEKNKIYITKSAVIICFIIFTLMPAEIIKSYYLNKCGLDKRKSFPALGYVYMGMTEGGYSAGWYHYDIAYYGYHQYENCREIYRELLKDRLNYFKENPKYTFNFYLTKFCSMWTENTHSCVRQKIKLNEEGKIVYDGPNCGLKDYEVFEILYQKALMFIIFGCSIIVLIQNIKNLSNELLLLVIIFIGGFLFHFLWEAKSRYIMPYIIVLIPVASIMFNKINFKRLKKIKEKN